MSATFDTYVIAGVRVSDIFAVQKRQKVENKFNRDTGKPEQIVTDVYVPVLFGRDQPELEPSPEEWVYGQVGNLEVFSTGADAKEDYTRRDGLTNPYAGYRYANYFVGVQLNKHPTKMYATPQVFELRPTSPEVTDALRKAHGELRKLGFTSEPKLYVVKYVSY